jgi:ATP-dependent Clp protease ATP-binding subunit ClpA
MTLERFTDRARKVMQLANKEAQNLRHEYIGTEHILLGLISEGNGLAANVLRNMDVNIRKLRVEVEKIVQSGPDVLVTVEHLPQTPTAKKVVEYAIDEARQLGHNYIGTEHLLLGLIRVENCVARTVLLNAGVKLEEVLEEILILLGVNKKEVISQINVGDRLPPVGKVEWIHDELPSKDREREILADAQQLAEGYPNTLAVDVECHVKMLISRIRELEAERNKFRGVIKMLATEVRKIL